MSKHADMLEGLEAASWEYKKPEQFGEGKHVGVMAQDLEKSEIGKTIVKDTPIGKMLDIRKLASTNTAALSHLHKRLRALEEKLKK